MRGNWEDEEKESKARTKAVAHCLKGGEWVDLVHEYEVRNMLRVISCGGELGQELKEEKNAAVRRWVSRNWEDFLPKGDPKEEFDYEENRT